MTRESFNGFEKFAFLFAILTLTLSGCVDLLWAWGLGRWVTPQVAPFFGRHNTLLTALGVVQLVLSSAALLSSYLVEEHQTRRHPMFFIGVLVTCLMMLVCSCPLAVFTAFTPPDTENDISNAIQMEIAGNQTPSVLEMAYNKFNCCGINNEPVCSKDYPPFILHFIENFNETLNETVVITNSTEVPCHAGSELCSNNCLEPVLENFVRPYKPIGTILAFIAFIISSVSPVLLTLSIFSSQFCPCYQPYYIAAKRRRKKYPFRSSNGKNRQNASNESLHSGHLVVNSGSAGGLIDEFGGDDDDELGQSGNPPRLLLHHGLQTDLALVRSSGSNSSGKRVNISNKTATIQ